MLSYEVRNPITTRPHRFRIIVAAAVAVCLVPESGFSVEPAAAPPSSSGKSLILAGWHGTTTPTPQFIVDNFAFLESRPFHGMAVYMADDPVSGTNVTTQLMTNTAMSYATISAVLDPIRNLPFSQLRDNLGLVVANDPPDFFDDWSIIVQNFSELARAVKDAGLKGIVFDNEQYFAPWGWYPDGVDYPQFTLAQYQAQAAARGREVMQAMLAEFPDIVVLCLHGPYISDPYCMQQMGFQDVFPYYQLVGPFFTGFLQVSGEPGRCVDGGELYWFRGTQEFSDSYNLRRYGIASDTADSPIIPPVLRPLWPGLSTIGFGVIDTPFETPFVQVDMTPAILKTTLSNALQASDKWVWLYTEARTFLLPESQGGATQEWVDAVRDGILAAEAPPPSAPSSNKENSSCGLLGIEAVAVLVALRLARSRRPK